MKKTRKLAADVGITGMTLGVSSAVVGSMGGDTSSFPLMAGFVPTMTTVKMGQNVLSKVKKFRRKR